MDKFAKLFERNGKQVLARTATNDDWGTDLLIEGRTVGGHALTLRVTFDGDDAARRASGALHALDEVSAFRMIEGAPGYSL